MIEDDKQKTLAVPGSNGTTHSVPMPEQFEILETLGQGGMGVVYKARNKFTNKIVAIKVLLAGAEDMLVQRFQREAQAACLLTHPNVVQTFDFGMAGDTPYIVMEYVQGETLDARLKRRGRLDVDEAFPMFLQVAGGVTSAHSEYIVHRDLKPSNIIFHKEESGKEIAKIFDFGIAKVDMAMNHNLTQTGEIFGTPLYMSPEQLKGERVDARSDVYSLGAVMYQTLTGEPPHKGDTVYSTMFKKINESPKSFAEHGVRVTGAIEQMIFTCLEVDPKDRFANASKLVAELERIERAKATQSAAAKIHGGTAFGSISGAKKKKINRTIGIAVLAVLIIGLAIGIYQYLASTDKARQLDDFMSRSDTAFDAKDFPAASDLAKEALTLTTQLPETVVSPQRKVSILERLMNCAHEMVAPVEELAYMNKLLPMYQRLDSAMLDEVLLNRRLNVLDTINKSGHDLLTDYYGEKSRNFEIAPQAKVIGQASLTEACRRFHAEWECLAPSALPDTRVRLKIVASIADYLRAIEGLDNVGTREQYYQEVLDFLPQVPANALGRAYFQIANYWHLRASRAQDEAERKTYLKNAEDFFLKCIDAHKDNPAHVYAISSYEGLANIYIDRKDFPAAKKYLDLGYEVLHNPKYKDVGDSAHYPLLDSVKKRYEDEKKLAGVK